MLVGSVKTFSCKLAKRARGIQDTIVSSEDSCLSCLCELDPCFSLQFVVLLCCVVFVSMCQHVPCGQAKASTHS